MNPKKRRFAFSLFLCLISIAPLWAQSYVTAIPHDREGILALLRRYDLPATPEMVATFRELNKMKANESLDENRTYKMPIIRYRYNGESIRTTLGFSDYARAQRIADYNNLMTDRGLREDLFTDSRDLWVPLPENKNLSRKSEIKPLTAPKPMPARIAQGNSAVWKLFGAKYEKVKIKDRVLAGRVYYIDAGHGGLDPGTIAEHADGFSLFEDEYAYDIALRFARNLLMHGATVYLTVQDPDDGIRDMEKLKPERGEFFYGGQEMVANFADRLHQRSGVVNGLFERHPEAKAHRLLSIHIDSRDLQKQPFPMDPHFSYYSGSEEGEQLARILFETMRSYYTSPSRTYNGTMQTRDQLHMLIYPKAVAVLVECGNLQHPGDQDRIMRPAYRQKLADLLTEGVLREAK